MTEEDDFVRRARARLGTTLKERWTLDALLGVGGMAAVYAATHRNGSRIAVKWLHTELALDKNMRERFVREGSIANRANHPGVVRVLDDDVAEDGSLLLFMELLEGETLDARWQRSGKRLAVAETLRIAHELLDVIAAAHDAGIVHRDLKPENLFLTHGGNLKVLDFGIARLREFSTKTGVTGSQSSLGTPAFMPPEQARGRWEEVDARTDIWAIGATMFTLLAGRRVHEAGTVNEQLLASMTEPAPALASVAPGIPSVVAFLVDRALAFKAHDRWQDARSMRAACADAFASITGQPISERRLSVSSVEAPPTFAAREAPTGADARLSGPMLTTGRAVASVVDGLPASAPRRRSIGYVAAAVVLAVTVVGAAIGVTVRFSRPATSGVEASAQRSHEPPAATSTAAAVAAPPVAAPPSAAPTESVSTAAAAPPVATEGPTTVVQAASTTPAPNAGRRPPTPTRPRASASAPAPSSAGSSDWHERRK